MNNSNSTTPGVYVKISAAERAALERAALDKGTTLSAVVRDALRRHLGLTRTASRPVAVEQADRRSTWRAQVT
jgi:hypothetical protein